MDSTASFGDPQSEPSKQNDSMTTVWKTTNSNTKRETRHLANVIDGIIKAGKKLIYNSYSKTYLMAFIGTFFTHI